MKADYNATHKATLPTQTLSRKGRGGSVREEWSQVVGWFDDRLGLSALRYKVPAHANQEHLYDACGAHDRLWTGPGWAGGSAWRSVATGYRRGP